MIKGENYLELNQDTMNFIVQEWINENTRAGVEHITVVDVSESDEGEIFRVTMQGEKE